MGDDNELWTVKPKTVLWPWSMEVEAIEEAVGVCCDMTGVRERCFWKLAGSKVPSSVIARLWPEVFSGMSRSMVELAFSGMPSLECMRKYHIALRFVS